MSEVVIKTSRFGDIQADPTRILNFVSPILGFEAYTRYIILDHAPDSPFRWLQSVDNPDLAFVVTNPKLFGIPYEFAIDEKIVEQLEIKTAEDALVLTIVNIPQENPGLMTANLLGPVVVNQHRVKAMQVILNDNVFSARTRLIPDETLNQPSPPIASSKGE